MRYEVCTSKSSCRTDFEKNWACGIANVFGKCTCYVFHGTSTKKMMRKDSLVQQEKTKKTIVCGLVLHCHTDCFNIHNGCNAMPNIGHKITFCTIVLTN